MGRVFLSRLQFSRDIGIDLGTANTLIWISGKGIVLQEPSVVAVDQKQNGATLAVGEKAKPMLGRTPRDITAVRPLSDGVIADSEATTRMLKAFLQKAHEGRDVIAPRMVIAVPGSVTASERRELRTAGEAHARQVFLVDEAVASALGAGMPVMDPVGTMIVDIGGGTTEVALLSLGRTVLSESIRVAGDELTEAISMHLKKVHNLVVGEQTAEDIKLRLGSVFPDEAHDQLTMDVRGLHLLSGLPRTVNVRGAEIREAMAETIQVIVESVRRTLERTPPELAADIVDRGIMISGGGALVRGICDLVSQETGILSHVAEDPLLCVARGCGIILDDFQKYEWVLDIPDYARQAA